MKSILLIGLFTATLAVQAQDDKPGKHQMQDMHEKHGKHGKFGEFMPLSTLGFGASFQKFDALNARIAGNSAFEPLKDAAGTIQLGWLKERKRLVSASEFGLGSSMSGDRGKKSSNLRFIGLGADIGYAVIKTKNVLLYPFGGIGYEWYQARFYKDNSALDFDDVLNSPVLQNTIKPVNFKNDYFVYRLGVGFNLSSPQSKGGGIGIKAGYNGSFSDQKWKSNDNQTLANSPKDGLSRFYVSLVLSHNPMMMHH